MTHGTLENSRCHNILFYLPQPPRIRGLCLSRSWVEPPAAATLNEKLAIVDHPQSTILSLTSPELAGTRGILGISTSRPASPKDEAMPPS